MTADVAKRLGEGNAHTQGEMASQYTAFSSNMEWGERCLLFRFTLGFMEVGAEVGRAPVCHQRRIGSEWGCHEMETRRRRGQGGGRLKREKSSGA